MTSYEGGFGFLFFFYMGWTELREGRVQIEEKLSEIEHLCVTYASHGFTVFFMPCLFVR